MSIENVKAQIQLFIESEIPEVLAIEGAWGTGKTFEWEHTLKECKATCSLKSYSYVSLFGLKSIQEVKKAAFLKRIDTTLAGEKPNLKGRVKNLGANFQDVKLPSVMRKFGGEGLLKAVSDLALTDTLICFDDLERYSGDVKEFMGLVSALKEQKDCKIVLLLNEDSLEKHSDIYRQQKEKVIDKQLRFSPTPAYCFDTTFDNDFEYKSLLRELCCSLNITNRRVLQKIISHVKDHLRVTECFDSTIQENIVKGITFLSWCYYCHGADKKTIPHMDYVTDSTKQVREALIDSEDHENDAWDSKLDILGKTYPYELRKALANGVKQGYVDIESLIPLCEESQSHLDSLKRSENLEKAWQLYHNSFKHNEEEVAEAFVTGLKEVAGEASAYSFSQGVSLLRDIGFADEADKMIELFIETRKDEPEIFNVNSFASFGVKDNVFDDRLNDAYDRYKPQLSVDDILQMRRGLNSYNQEDVEILAKLTEEQIYAIFTDPERAGENLYYDIKVFMLLASGDKTLADNVQKALKRIGDSSVINNRRLEKFRR